MWDCQRTVRASLLGSDDSQGPGFRCLQGVRRGSSSRWCNQALPRKALVSRAGKFVHIDPAGC
eukprot:5418673-Pyramimonas_sp.AAC.1